ncbi:MAG: STM4011 family radical SAM protein, partial [Lachnospiraceae bacterium]|nr:STM4011 family radical SAM protein [Lachnospiraceae bacterium]
MDRHMILYRGSLKSCNYHCSYCPFSKHPMSARELEKDKIQWFSFIRRFQEKAEVMKIGALMIVPYGEAMIHPWYWEGLAQLSALAQIDAVGIQTNLSFSVNDFTDCYVNTGGVFAKLRLWATFHPEMTSVSDFAAKCRKLRDQGIQLCAGIVGVPQNLDLLQQLKRELDGIYLWVNKMDGLRRGYSQEEQEAFLEIDPYFERELMLLPANAALCHERLFVSLMCVLWGFVFECI